MRTIVKEQYFTNPSLAQRCIDRVKQHYDLNLFSLILEPSAGDGSFYNLLDASKTVALDIEPMHSSVIRSDFFLWDCSTYTNVLCIGNPPFGRRAQIATKFINHAAKFSSVIAFILPRTFKKESFYDRIDKSFHLVDQFDCDEFVCPDGKEIKIKCVFQIWEKRDCVRKLEDRKISHEDFVIKHAHMSKISKQEFEKIKSCFDFSIPQVGNFALRDINTITGGSHWFVQVHDKDNIKLFKNLDFSFLDNTNLSFNSLSRKDIVQAYETIKNATKN